MSRKIKMIDKKLEMKDEIDAVFEKKVSSFGTGAKIDCPKEFLGKRVYILVRK